MPREMKRNTYMQSRNVNDEANADWIDLEDFAAGSVQTTGALTMEIYASLGDNPDSDTFVAAYDEDGEGKTITAGAAGVWNLPSMIFHYRYIKLIGTDTDVPVFLKS